MNRINPINIAILDDHVIVRHGIQLALAARKNLVVTGAYSSSQELLKGLQSNPAQILIVDYSLQAHDMDGINLLRMLAIKFPKCKIVAMSSFDDAATIALIKNAGAHLFVSKAEPLDVLIGAIFQLAQTSGDFVLDPNTFYAARNANAVPLSRLLTARENEVIRCVLEGMSVTQIAHKFFKSRKTISAQKMSAFSKLNIHSDQELVELFNKSKSDDLT